MRILTLVLMILGACESHLRDDRNRNENGGPDGTGDPSTTDGSGPPTGGDSGSTDGTEWPRAELQLIFPVRDPEEVAPGIQNPYYDHDDTEETCLDYDGYTDPWCFDAHKGTDYTLLGSYHAMDAGLGDVVAAADGVVSKVRDGNYDRCHPGPKGIDCDGYPVVANFVIITHDTGEQTEYWHLAIGIEVVVGQRVKAGDVLGRMGSSASYEPNVHFEVQDMDGVAFDPYAGKYSQPLTYWCGQNAHGELPDTSCD